MYGSVVCSGLEHNDSRRQKSRAHTTTPHNQTCKFLRFSIANKYIREAVRVLYEQKDTKKEKKNNKNRPKPEVEERPIGQCYQSGHSQFSIHDNVFSYSLIVEHIGRVICVRSL